MTTVRNEAPEPRAFLVEVQLENMFTEDQDGECWTMVCLSDNQELAEREFNLLTYKNPEWNYRVIEVLLQSSSAIWEETES